VTPNGGSTKGEPKDNHCFQFKLGNWTKLGPIFGIATVNYYVLEEPNPETDSWFQLCEDLKPKLIGSFLV
jgi:hypothetical protein